MSRRRVVRAFAAVYALVTVSTVGPAVRARAAAPGVDQITGNGETASAVTASWSQGLLGADNRTVVAPRDPNSSLAFMYDDFKNLKVTVSQTQSLVNQAVKVSWTGGKSTIGVLQGDFLQMMQCYGDANTGPDPENCEYGSKGMLPADANQGIGGRAGRECVPGSVPSTDFPSKTPGGRDGSFPNNACDTREPTDPTHDDTTPGNFGWYRVPFVPVGTTDKLYDAAPNPQYANYFDKFSTNEVQGATTNADGTGQQFFQVDTAIEAPGLGCGEVRSDSTPRDCWLVIVPRGEYKANGYKISTSTDTINRMTDSPLGASNWAQRIQIHLGFAPVATNCAIGSAKERETVGTQVVSHAVFSWQLALNHAADCKTIYGYTAVPESTSTQQLTDSSSGVGLAFTTIPIGAEAARKGAPLQVSEPIVYAPVAVSALTLAFNINISSSGGYIPTPIKLTPRLLAKALTQSYRSDLPDVTNNHAGRQWAAHNPDFITTDPEFMKLNPGVNAPSSFNPVAPLLTEDLSALNQQVWAWIDSDRAARDWLSGNPDTNGMVINPNYKRLKLNQAPIDSFPRADPTCFNTEPDLGEREPGRCTLNLLPYVNDYTDAATRIRTANNPEAAGWDPQALAPDGQSGWFGGGGIEVLGQQFMWGLTDSANVAGLGLVPADLCDAAGQHCVGPATSSVSTALANAMPDSTGILHVDPAHPGSGGYPLVNVTYAAAQLDQPAAARNDYASLIQYAATTGQTPGVDPGQLPHGYLPLPSALRNQAMAATVELRCGQVCPTNEPGGTSSPQQPGSNNGGNPGGSGGTGANGGTGGTGGTGGSTSGTSSTSGAGGNAGSSSVPGGAHGKSPSAGNSPGSTVGHGIAGPQPDQLAGKTLRTPGTAVGVLRWALLVIAIAGLVGAVAVPLSKTGAFPRLLRMVRRQT
jgi:hypothetical protein